jgi:hypothetical protein
MGQENTYKRQGVQTTSILDRVNPNMAIVLTFVSRTLWIALAVFFGVIGFNLYTLGVVQTGSTDAHVLWISFSLKDAGPGLIVMVFALACSVVGAVRTRIKITPATITLSKATLPDPIEETFRSARECKLFGKLLEHLARGPIAFAVLNSKGHVDIESLGWSAVPIDIRAQAVSGASKWMSSHKADQRTGAIAGWSVLRTAFAFGNGVAGCVVALNPRDVIQLSHIGREDTTPLLYD